MAGPRFQVAMATLIWMALDMRILRVVGGAGLGPPPHLPSRKQPRDVCAFLLRCREEIDRGTLKEGAGAIERGGLVAVMQPKRVDGVTRAREQLEQRRASPILRSTFQDD